MGVRSRRVRKTAFAKLLPVIAASGLLAVASVARAETTDERESPAIGSTYTLSPSEPPRVGSNYRASLGEMPPQAEKPRTEARWYGAPTLITDSLAVAGFAGFLATFKINICLDLFGNSGGASNCPHHDNTAAGLFLTGATLSYAFGGPVNHAAHGHWDRAALSLGMRVTPILVAIPVGSMQGESAGRASGILAIGGIVAAMIVDGAILPNDTVVVEPTEPKVTLLPQFDPKTRTAGFSLGGTF